MKINFSNLDNFLPDVHKIESVIVFHNMRGQGTIFYNEKHYAIISYYDVDCNCYFYGSSDNDDDAENLSYSDSKDIQRLYEYLKEFADEFGGELEIIEDIKVGDDGVSVELFLNELEVELL